MFQHSLSVQASRHADVIVRVRDDLGLHAHADRDDLQRLAYGGCRGRVWGRPLTV